MKKLNTLSLFLVGITLLACSSNKAPIQAPVASQPTISQNNDQQLSNNPKDINAIYFAFDKYDIDNQYQNIISKNANYLSENKTSNIKIEGNTDDIGSVEYNLSLGQKRSDVVKKALISLGANSNQVEATSNGKIKPKFDNNTSDSRAQNRRSDILYNQNPINGYEINKEGLPVIN